MARVDSALPGDEDVLRGATIREVSQAVFSSGSARRAWRLYKATVQRRVSQEELVQELVGVRDERQTVSRKLEELVYKSIAVFGDMSDSWLSTMIILYWW
jgi:hypothetical protein